MKKRALVIGGGGLRGAYDAGVVSTLCQKLGSDYFDAIYACSAGTYTAPHFVLNQPDSLENLWRNYVDGRKFVNFFSAVRNHNIFNLEYLTDLLKREKTFLHIENFLNISACLIYVVTERHTGKSVYIQPTQKNILHFMKASSAFPFLHTPVALNGITYIDGTLSDPLPFRKAAADGYEHIVVVYNKPKGSSVSDRYDTFSHVLAPFLPPTTAHLVRTLNARCQKIEQRLESENGLKIIRPKTQLPLKSILDTNKARLNACVDMGIADAKEFLKTYRPL